MSEKANLGLNIGTLAAVLIALFVGGFIAADIYDLVHKSIKQSQENSIQIAKTANKLNQSYDQILQAQGENNKRGNATIQSFEDLFSQIISSEDNIIGNLSDHRRIANISYVELFDRLDMIAHTLNKSYNPPPSNIIVPDLH